MDGFLNHRIGVGFLPFLKPHTLTGPTYDALLVPTTAEKLARYYWWVKKWRLEAFVLFSGSGADGNGRTYDVTGGNFFLEADLVMGRKPPNDPPITETPPKERACLVTSQGGFPSYTNLQFHPCSGSADIHSEPPPMTAGETVTKTAYFSTIYEGGLRMLDQGFGYDVVDGEYRLRIQLGFNAFALTTGPGMNFPILLTMGGAATKSPTEFDGAAVPGSAGDRVKAQLGAETIFAIDPSSYIKLYPLEFWE